MWLKNCKTSQQGQVLFSYTTVGENFTVDFFTSFFLKGEKYITGKFLFSCNRYELRRLKLRGCLWKKIAMTITKRKKMRQTNISVLQQVSKTALNSRISLIVKLLNTNNK